jgi:hypothetical protein
LQASLLALVCWRTQTSSQQRLKPQSRCAVPGALEFAARATLGRLCTLDTVLAAMAAQSFHVTVQVGACGVLALFAGTSEAAAGDVTGPGLTCVLEAMGRHTYASELQLRGLQLVRQLHAASHADERVQTDILTRSHERVFAGVCTMS